MMKKITSFIVAFIAYSVVVYIFTTDYIYVNTVDLLVKDYIIQSSLLGYYRDWYYTMHYENLPQGYVYFRKHRLLAIRVEEENSGYMEKLSKNKTRLQINEIE